MKKLALMAIAATLMSAFAITAVMAQEKAKAEKAKPAPAEEKMKAGQAETEGVKAASKAFYAALAVLDNGEAMAKVWAHTPYITNLGPSGNSITVGWDANSKYWEPSNKRYASRNASLSEPHIHVNGNLAWEMGNEIGEGKLKDGTVRKIDNFATNVYEKIDGRWLMVSHHAQPKPQ